MKRVLLFVVMTTALLGCKKEEDKIVPQQKQEEKTFLLYGKWQFEKYEEYMDGQKEAEDTSEHAKCMLKNVLTLTETKYALASYSYDESIKKCKSVGTSEYDYELKDSTITIKNGGQVYAFEVKDHILILTSTTKEGNKELKVIEYYKKTN